MTTSMTTTMSMTTKVKPRTKAKAQHNEQSPWRTLTVDCAMAMADTFASVLLEQGALGLETEDDETRAVPGKEARLTGCAALIATFSRVPGLEAKVGARIAQIVNHVAKAKDTTLTWADLWPEDWNAIFMAHWKPFRLGRRVWIVPSWERDRFVVQRVGPGRQPLVLHLDPGMAFGTGQHETTQLCTEAVERHLDDKGPIKRLLDVGTGTGILALVALRLGAQHAKGTDIDPVAVKAALDNARDNGVADRFDANDDAPDHDGAGYDVVVANILAGTLIELVRPIAGAVAPGGELWLSGVLAEQERAVVDAYVAVGLEHRGTARKNDWVRVDFLKRI
ncbi:MAG: 50S ribosomal protein L11 methyltransferase [Deltaproteobacteria bacterium]|nr:50S ribosomal protein L11 methyltransferase [Deltaproteobacteria bacterium]